MKRPNSNQVIAVGLLLVLCVSSYSVYQVHRIHTGIQLVLEEKKVPMQTITQTITNDNGEEITISTVRNENESLADWKARHEEAVNEFVGG